MSPLELTLKAANDEDFDYVYSLSELTMRSCVETDLGDCFEKVARPTIRKLLARSLFSKIYVDGVVVGAVAYEMHSEHIQLEEIYLEPAMQRRGLGTELMKRLVERSKLLALPIRLHVLASNPARALYERLGFAVTRSTSAVIYMEYTPTVAGDA